MAGPKMHIIVMSVPFNLKYITRKARPIGVIFRKHCHFKSITREQARFFFNGREITAADDQKLPDELGIQDNNKLYWYPAVLSDDDEGEEAIDAEYDDDDIFFSDDGGYDNEPEVEDRVYEIVLSDDDEGEEAIEVPNPPGAVPNPPGAVLATDDAIDDEYDDDHHHMLVIDDELSEEEAAERIYVEIVGYADGELWQYQVEFHGRVEVLLDFHCRRMQLDRQRQRFQFEKNGREVTPEWVTFENHLMENCEQINIISIDAPEYQLMRFVTDVTSYEPETEEAEDQAVERQEEEEQHQLAE